MKRLLCMLCAAALLSAAGCSTSGTQEGEADTTSASVTEGTSETADAETSASVTTDPPLETTAPDETASAASSAVDTETGTTVPGDAEPDASIFGRWSYGGFYEMVFHEDYTVTLCTDFSEVMFIEDGVLTMDDVRIPLTVTDGRVCAAKGEETVLSMIPQDGADTASMTGRFLLEPCSVLNAVGNPDSGASYYIHLTGARFLVETPAEYRMDQENQMLYMINTTGTMPLHYSLNGDTLRISDSEGNVDEMTRIE